MRRDSTILITITVACILCGISMIYSISAVQVANSTIIFKHLVYLGLGSIAFLIMMYNDYHRLATPKMRRLIVMGTVVLLILTFVPPFRQVRGGAARWVGMGPFVFQPSELAKFCVVLLLSLPLTQNQEHIKKFCAGFLMPGCVAGFFCVIVIAQKDIGIPLVIALTTLLMILVAGGSIRYTAVTGILGAVGGVCLIMMYDYRIDRVKAALDPFKYRDTSGYHVVQSLSSFTQGGLWGSGAGAGEQKLGFLPAAHTDFIFAAYAEDFGLIGALILLTLFLGLIFIGLRIAANAPDMFGFLLATGITLLLGVQTTFIMTVNLGLFPAKGLPLPFVSYGGSALVVSLFMTGILVNIGIQGELNPAGKKTSLLPRVRPPSFLSRSTT